MLLNSFGRVSRRHLHSIRCEQSGHYNALSAPHVWPFGKALVVIRSCPTGREQPSPVADTTGQHKSVLLLEPQLQAIASSSCQALSEALLPANQSFFKTDLVPVLNFEVTFLNTFPPNQEFWIASSGHTCQTVDAQGHIRSSSCLRTLPVLCSQSAAYGAGPSVSSMVKVQSSGLTLTGYVTACFSFT